MCELVLSIQEFFKLVPGLVIFPLSFYLAWKKLGIKVAASFTVQYQRTTAKRISEVVLVNLKDKPVTVFAIYAVIDQDISWEIDKFDPPIILKPLESSRIETEPYSELYLGADKFEPNFISPSKIDIFIVTPHKIVKCKTVSHPNLLNIPVFKHYRSATKNTRRFNNIVYNNEAAYAITYVLNSEVITAIVDQSGFIGSNFGFGFNMVPVECMKSKDDLRTCLEQTSFGKMVDRFVVDKLE
jgi:hypothetical protein